MTSKLSDVDRMGPVYRTRKGAANYAASLSEADSGFTKSWTGREYVPLHLSFQVAKVDGGYQVERVVVWL